MVLCTFSPARAWRPTVGAPLARTLGITQPAQLRTRYFEQPTSTHALRLRPNCQENRGDSEAIGPSAVQFDRSSRHLVQRRRAWRAQYCGLPEEPIRARSQATDPYLRGTRVVQQSRNPPAVRGRRGGLPSFAAIGPWLSHCKTPGASHYVGPPTEPQVRWKPPRRNIESWGRRSDQVRIHLPHPARRSFALASS